MKKMFRVNLLIGAAALIALALTGCSNGRSTRAIAVTEVHNNRVLVYNYPITSNGQAANRVLGQADFVSNAPATTATGMFEPGDAVQDHAGNLWVCDEGNQRVLEFVPPFSNGMAASLVIGQPDFVTSGANITQNGLSDCAGIAFDHSGNLWVVDFDNSRILEYVPPFITDMNATLVIGQANFTSGGFATTATGLDGPNYTAFDHSGNLWVADGDNSRVLEFMPPFSTGMAASLVIGQVNFTSAVVNTTASTLGGYATGIAFDRAGNLWVGDTENSRVLQYLPPFATGMSASLVIGQPDFVTAGANTTQNGLSGSFGLDFDSRGNLAIADYGNNRTLAFKPPFTTGQLAAGVLGQPDFVTNTATTTAVGQSGPISVRPLY